MTALHWAYGMISRVLGYKKPKRPKKVRLDMTTRTLSWELSAPTPRQLPIDRTEISIRVDSSLPWSFHDAVAPDSLQQIVL